MDIAVVGMDCLLPGATSAEEWISNSKAGRISLSEVPDGRWPMDPKSVLSGELGKADTTATLRGGFVDALEPQSEDSPTANLDPLFHWAVRVGRQAMNGVKITGARTGLFAGSLALPTSGAVKASAKKLAHTLHERNIKVPWLDGGNPLDQDQSGLLAQLTATTLGITGEAIALDAACASSLYAVEIACRQLRAGQLDAALAIGINRADSSYLFIGFSQLYALSKRGTPEPFGQDADGLVVGEGAAAVVLKRLDDAVRDGDTIHGVIRGGSLGNDGLSGNLLAPNTQGQFRCLANAYKQTNIPLSSVGFMECHATGTPVGDSSELKAIQRLLEESELPEQPIVLSSAKALIGHTVTAAGLAGLIRAIGAVRDGFLPPTPIETPLQDIIESPHLEIINKAREWTAPVRRGGVSAFGFGGTNAHLIVENYRKNNSQSSIPTRSPHREPLAIIAAGAQLGPCQSMNELEAALLKQSPLIASPTEAIERGLGPMPKGSYMEQVSVPLGRYRIPPLELAKILPQQLAVLNACQEALATLNSLDTQSTATVVGMEIDGHVSDHVLRWALQEKSPELANRLANPLETAFVQGSLPNFVANRLSAQFDLQGPSYAVSAGAISGIAAIQQATILLDDPNISAVVVGSTDMGGHYSRSDKNSPAICEGAGVFVLKRLQDATTAGDTILGTLDNVELGRSLQAAKTEPPQHRDLIGHGRSFDSFAGLLYHLIKGDKSTALSLVYKGHLDHQANVLFTPGTCQWKEPTDTETKAIVIPHSLGAILKNPLFSGKWGQTTVPVPIPGSSAPARVSFQGLAAPAMEPLTFDRWCGAPKQAQSPKVVDSRPLTSTPKPLAPVPPVASSPPTPRKPEREPAPQPTLAQPTPLGQLAQQVAKSHSAAVEAHESFLLQEQRFLDELRQVGQTLQQMTGLLQSGNLPTPSPGSAPNPPLATNHRLELEVLKDFTKDNATKSTPCIYDYKALEVHAAGELSEVFGPEYADLDHISPRVRMPMAPLLLCSRVTAIEGTRDDLSSSSLTTEYDIPIDAWWSHDGKAPPCVIVESGQADLFLVSYLGIDKICNGERLYRLLDCDLTFHDERPALGETLRHSIRIKRFAQLGGKILFYFEYDCVATSDGRPILTMRNGCAGFFTPAELATPTGLKLPEDAPQPVQLHPLLTSAPSQLNEAKVAALTTGAYSDAFGPEFSPADGSPLRLSPTEYRMIHRVQQITFSGGAYGQGGLIAEQDLRDNDWFNSCHFKDDPCMPGTLMFDGCNQALQTWLMAAGWATEYPKTATFEPVAGVTTKLRCRGQIIPGHSLASYEVRVKEAGDDGHPWVIADVILSVDGTPVVLAENVSTRIQGDRAPLVKTTAPTVETPAVFEFSIGVPSLAFGQAFAPYDAGQQRVARMPGPPLLFIDRAYDIDGPQLQMAADRSVAIDYQIPENAWYFEADPASSMPFVILLEAALQPCGWLTAWQGANLSKGRNTYFRNLGGKATYYHDILPTTGTLTTRATQTSVSNAAGMSLHFFDYQVNAGDKVMFEGNTYFGYFTDEALADQKGLPLTPADVQRRLDIKNEAGIQAISLNAAPGMPRPDLLMLDRVTVCAPASGTHQLGYYEAEKDVDPTEWFFQAHFYQDPVMPGSLGLEALLQLSRWVLMERTGCTIDQLIPMHHDQEIEWVYRGQVTGERERVTVAIDVVEIGEGEEAYIVCNGLLSADGIPLYSLNNFGLRVLNKARTIVDAPTQREPQTAALLNHFEVNGQTGHGILHLDPRLQPWLDDHRPTLTAAALPMAFAAEIAAEAATAICPSKKVIGLPKLEAKSWIHTGDGPLDVFVVAIQQGDCVAVTLSIHHENPKFPQLSGPKVHMEAIVQLGANYPEAPELPPELTEATPNALDASSYYNGGHTFHGPSLHGVTDLGSHCQAGSTSTFHTKPDRELLGFDEHVFVLDPLILDTATHPMMSATPEMWSKDIPKGKLAYPVLCDNMRFFSQRPTGAIRCELRTLQADANQIAFDVWLIGKDGPWACFKWVEALVNAGPLLAITPEERVRTLIGDEANPAIRLGEVLNNSWQVNTGAIIDPLPGTTAALLCSEAELNTRRDSPNKLEWDIRRIAAKECLQQHIFGEAGIRVHPRNIDLLELPKNRFIARHIVGLTAQQFIELAGPTKIHIAVNSTLETASALIKLGPCIPSA